MESKLGAKIRECEIHAGDRAEEVRVELATVKSELLKVVAGSKDDD